jgi:hypothetical protein
VVCISGVLKLAGLDVLQRRVVVAGFLRKKLTGVGNFGSGLGAHFAFKIMG